MGFRNVQRLDGKPLIGVKPLAELLATTSARRPETGQHPREQETPVQPFAVSPHDQHAGSAARALEQEVSASLRHELHGPITTARPRHRRSGAGGDRRGPDCLQRGPSAEDARASVGRLELGRLVARRSRNAGAEDNRNPTWLRVDFAPERLLQITVPVAMRERFNWVADTGTSVATDPNFRRFQTSARIVPQP